MFTVIELLSEETISAEIGTFSKDSVQHCTHFDKHIPGVAQHKHL